MLFDYENARFILRLNAITFINFTHGILMEGMNIKKCTNDKCIMSIKHYALAEVIWFLSSLFPRVDMPGNA